MKTTRTRTLLSIGILLLLRSVVAANFGYRGDHISINFYIAGENADKSKDNLNALLDRYPYNPQANRSHNLVSIPPYFDAACNASSLFAALVEDFFNAAKNESANLLLKLRQVPSAQTISDRIKSQLTDYFTEMENFHVVLCAVLDDAMEFTLDSVRVAKRALTQYTDVHNDLVEQHRHQPDECIGFASDFLWQSADEIFKCATGKLCVTYDIYSITKMTTYHVMKMLEHRIQKLYNCFVFGNYPIRCRFVRNAEADFVKLHARLDDLMMYNDKQKRKIFRKRGGFLKCIPEDFPDGQMSESIKSCLRYG